MLRFVATNLPLVRCAVPAWAHSSACLSTGPSPADEERRKWVNKLLYRSKQRGFLELDLLVGLWAEQTVPHMEPHMLQQFSIVLEQENPDLFKWLTGRQQAPQEMLLNPTYQALSQHVAHQLAQNAPVAAQAAAGREWLRGWDDPWRSNPPAAPEAAAAAAASGCGSSSTGSRQQ